MTSLTEPATKTAKKHSNKPKITKQNRKRQGKEDPIQEKESMTRIERDKKRNKTIDKKISSKTL